MTALLLKSTKKLLQIKFQQQILNKVYSKRVKIKHQEKYSLKNYMIKKMNIIENIT
jgi:hypothetical protein